MYNLYHFTVSHIQVTDSLSAAVRKRFTVGYKGPSLPPGTLNQQPSGSSSLGDLQIYVQLFNACCEGDPKLYQCGATLCQIWAREIGLREQSFCCSKLVFKLCLKQLTAEFAVNVENHYILFCAHVTCLCCLSCSLAVKVMLIFPGEALRSYPVTAVHPRD